MLRKLHSVLAVALSVVLGAACLSGCGGAGDSGGGDEIQSVESGALGGEEVEKSSEAEAPSEAETEASSEAEAIDLGGREITLVSWGTTLFELQEDAADEVGQTYWSRMKEMEEKYHCTFVLNVISYGEILPNLRAGEMSDTPYADVVMMRQAEAKSAYKEGLLLDLSQVMDGSQFYQPAVNLFKEDDGKFYTIAFEKKNHVENFLVFNKEHFVNQGIDVDALYQEVLDGKWTFDRLFEIADQATVVKDGVTEVYGSQGISVYDDQVEFWMQPFGAELLAEGDDGNAVSGLRSENMQKALETLSRMTQSDSFWKRSNNEEWDTFLELFKSGKVAMVCNTNGIDGIKGWVENDVVNFDIGVLPMPKASESDEYCYTALTMNVAAMPASLGKDMETARAIADMLNYIYSPVGESEESQLERSCASFSTDEAMVQILVEGGMSDHFEPSSFYSAGMNSQYKGTCREKFAEILKGETSIGAGIDAIDEAWQAAIDEYNTGL